MWLIRRAAADLGVKVARSIWEAVEGLRECEGVRGERAAILGGIGLWGCCGMGKQSELKSIYIYIYICLFKCRLRDGNAMEIASLSGTIYPLTFVITSTRFLRTQHPNWSASCIYTPR